MINSITKFANTQVSQQLSLGERAAKNSALCNVIRSDQSRIQNIDHRLVNGRLPVNEKSGSLPHDSSGVIFLCCFTLFLLLTSCSQTPAPVPRVTVRKRRMRRQDDLDLAGRLAHEPTLLNAKEDEYSSKYPPQTGGAVGSHSSSTKKVGEPTARSIAA